MPASPVGDRWQNLNPAPPVPWGRGEGDKSNVAGGGLGVNVYSGGGEIDSRVLGEETQTK